MWKVIGAFASCFVIVLVALILLQPSSQESALGALASAEKVLDQIKASEAPTKLDAARKLLTDLRLPSKNQDAADKIISAIDEAKSVLGSNQASLNGATAEIKAQITQAKGNLTALTATERARGVKDQILTLVWPLVVATLILYLVNSKSSLQLLTHLGSIISNVKVPGGLEIAFASTTVKNTQEDVLRSYRQQVIAQYDAVAIQNQISETLDRIVKNRITPFFEGQANLKKPDFRCTIHVRDILFQNSLYQLIDYLPRKWRDTGKGGRGRAWSVRYGMLGRYWRLEESGFKGTVPTNHAQLINDWGMTKTEAESASGRQTLFCLLIRAKNQSPVALLYLDAEPANAFGDAAQMSELGKVVDNAVKEFGLDTALEEVWKKVQPIAPLIEIYADRK